MTTGVKYIIPFAIAFKKVTEEHGPEPRLARRKIARARARRMLMPRLPSPVGS